MKWCLAAWCMTVLPLLAAWPAHAISYDEDPALLRIERAQDRAVREAQARGELTPQEQRRIQLMDARNDYLVSALRLHDGALRAEDRARALAALDEESALIRDLADSHAEAREGVVYRPDGGPAPLGMARSPH